MTPQLPLDTFRAEIDYHPFHFFGLALNTIEGLKAQDRCNPPLLKHQYQDAQQVGRDDIARAIEEAEQQIHDTLGFWPAPRYTNALVDLTPYYANGYRRYGVSLGSDGRWLSVNLPDRHVQEIGVESATLLGQADVAYTDDDGDGVEENWTATFELTDTTLTAADLLIRVPENYWLDSCEPLDIEPVTLCISASEDCDTCNTLSIKGKRWQMVQPEVYEGFAGGNASYEDPTDDSLFLTQVEVWKRITSAGGITVETAQAVLVWETLPCPGWVCPTDPTDYGTDPATVGQAVARAGIRSKRLGIVTPAQAVYNAVSGIWASATCLTQGRLPDRVTVRYRAGYPFAIDRNGNARMAREMREMVVRLAAANLDSWVDGCGAHTMNRRLYHWQEDLAETGGDKSYQLGTRDLDNPWGTRRGQALAWKQAQRLAVVGGWSV